MKPSALLMNPMTCSTCLILSREPRCFFSWARQLRQVSLAAWYPSSTVSSWPTIPLFVERKGPCPHEKAMLPAHLAPM